MTSKLSSSMLLLINFGDKNGGGWMVSDGCKLTEATVGDIEERGRNRGGGGRPMAVGFVGGV